MDVLTPRTLDEALRLKAERPGARCILGGTDGMVELTFGESRPEALVNLGRARGAPRLVARERRAAARSGPDVHPGDGATARRGAAGARRGVAHQSGSPEIRNRGTLGGNLGTASPAGERPAAAPRRGGRGRARERPRRPHPTARGVPTRKRTRSRPDELVTAVHPDPHGRPADLHEGRRPERDGDRDLLALPSSSTARRARCAPPSAAETARPRTLPLADASTLPNGSPRRRADRRRPRDGGLPSPRAPRPRGRALDRCLVASRDRADRQRRAARGRRPRRREPADVPARALELPGSKNACEQGECGSCSVVLDGASCARASSSPPRPTATRW